MVQGQEIHRKFYWRLQNRVGTIGQNRIVCVAANNSVLVVPGGPTVQLLDTLEEFMGHRNDQKWTGEPTLTSWDKRTILHGLNLGQWDTMKRDAEDYIEYLITTGANRQDLEVTRRVLHNFAMWAVSGRLPELQMTTARVMSLFGMNRSGYVTARDLSTATRGLPKTFVRRAMCEIGFEEHRPWIDGVRTRVWARGVGGTETNLMPPCPVPLP
jgi:hypothetical protein